MTQQDGDSIAALGVIGALVVGYFFGWPWGVAVWVVAAMLTQ